MASNDDAERFVNGIRQFVAGVNEAMTKAAAARMAKEAEAAANAGVPQEDEPTYTQAYIREMQDQYKAKMMDAEVAIRNLQNQLTFERESRPVLRCVMCHAQNPPEALAKLAVTITSGHAVCEDHVDEVIEVGA